jgi:predicted RNase H-like nuclease (RuvC/YqgF family)
VNTYEPVCTAPHEPWCVECRTAIRDLEAYRAEYRKATTENERLEKAVENLHIRLVRAEAGSERLQNEFDRVKAEGQDWYAQWQRSAASILELLNENRALKLRLKEEG